MAGRDIVVVGGSAGALQVIRSVARGGPAATCSRWPTSAIGSTARRGAPAPGGALAGKCAGGPGEHSRARGIALSGYGSEADRQRSREAGFADHLTKPVDFARLLESVNRTAFNTDSDPA